MQPLAISLEDFTFPKDLDKSKANFRFVVELHYFDKTGRPRTATGTVPSIDSYWECDWTRAQARPPLYVGPDPGPRGGKPEAYGTIDPDKPNPHDKLAMLVNTNGGIYSLNCTLYDVDRRDFWDAVLERLSSALETLLGKLGEYLPDSISTPEEVRGALARKLAGPSDRIIGTRGILLSNRLGKHQIQISVGRGDYQGTFEMTFLVDTIADPQE